jgi:seryl-tRNA synthetase
VHTLNGSGLAVGRCLIAVLETRAELREIFMMPTG